MSAVKPTKHWKKGQLQDLVFFQRGFDITQAQQTPGPYPVISSSGVTSHHNEFKVHGPGVIIGRKGTLGSVHYAYSDYWPHDTTLWSKDLKGNNPRFVYYYLHTFNLKRFDVGNSNPTLNRNHIHDLPALVPPPRDQNRIADILSAYDDLIENNRRRMALLEEAARQLYREWFVRLRFPGHEHTRVVDGVPEGWERKPVGQLTAFLSRGIAPLYDEDSDGLVINQKCVRSGRLDLSAARRQSREFKAERQIQVGDILVNSTGEGTLGRVAQVLRPSSNCTVDSHVTIVRPNPDIGSYYFGQALLAMEPMFSTMGRGATNQTELSREQIGQTTIFMPARVLVDQFELVCAPISSQVATLQVQNEKLRAARDLLLPRLMSGELEV